jgi:tetratricopeptide (TPR) repeat protein
LTAPDGLRRIWFSLDSPSQYFPLVYTVFRWEYSWWGLSPAGYHWVNILLHAVNALLLWRLLRRLEVPGAWLAAALFAIHPVQVESVAWVTELKNVLMGMFFLLALHAWVRFGEAEKPRWPFYLLALAAQALALLAKTTACTLPTALLLVLWLKHTRITFRRLLEVGPFAALGVAMGLLSVWWEHWHLGLGKLFSIPIPERFLIASHALWFYAGKLAWPAHLTFIYPLWKVSAHDPRCYLWPAAIACAGAAVLWARKRLGRGPEAGLTFFAVTLGPVLGFIMLYTFRLSFVADHYQYLACIGLLALFAAGWARTMDRLAVSWLRPASAGAILCVMGILTWRQCGMYADAETLYRQTLARNPACWMAACNLADELIQKGKIEEAASYCRKALELGSDNPEPHLALGYILLENGQVPRAIPQFEAALEMATRLDMRAVAAKAHHNLGVAFFREGKPDEAIAQCQKALEMNFDRPETHVCIGGAFLQKGALDSAVEHYLRAVSMNPLMPEAHNDLASALLLKGDVKQAATHYERALQIKPDYFDACANLARILSTCPDASLRDGPRAVGLAGKANLLAGGRDPGALSILAAALAEAKRFPEAIQTADKALELARAQGNIQVAKDLEKDLVLYRAGSPFREDSR